MLTRLDLRGRRGADWRSTLPRPQLSKETGVAAVQAILADVLAHGDAAVREHT